MNACIFSPDRIYRYVLRCQCAPLSAETAPSYPFAESNLGNVRYLDTPAVQDLAPPDSKTATRLSSPKSCPTKPELYNADRSTRPRKRGTLQNQNVGEVGRTRMRAKRRRIAWIGLNPSTADEVSLDQTLATVCRYSRQWGFAEVVMLNLFAFRATDPRDLKQAT